MQHPMYPKSQVLHSSLVHWPGWGRSCQTEQALAGSLVYPGSKEDEGTQLSLPGGSGKHL